nr:hypothetical protein [Tanacetum cinerariifolium]
SAMALRLSQYRGILLNAKPYSVLSYDESKSRRESERAFMTLGQLQNQLGKDELQDKSMASFWVLNNQFQKFIDWHYFLDYESEMTEMLFVEYTRIKVKQFKETLLLHMGNVKKSVAERTHKHITRSSNGTYITHAVDADIKPVNYQESSVKVHLIAQHNVLANEQQHTDQSEPSYDTYLLEKVDSNTTLDSTNMCHRRGEIDQDAEQDQVKSSLLKVEFLKINDRNSTKESYGSNDMAHNYYLEEAKKKTQDKNMNLKPSVMHTASLQNTTNGSKLMPRCNNQTSRSLPVSKSSCGMWIPTGKMFTDYTTKVDSEPLNGSNDDITNPYECDQTLNVSACTLNLSAVTTVHSSSGLALHRQMAFADNTSGLAPQRKESTGPAHTFLMPGQISSGLVPNLVPAAPYVPLTNKDLEILFQPMFDEYLEPPRVDRPVSPALAVLVPINSACTPSSTTIDQDVPSLIHSPSSSTLQPPCSHQGVAAEFTLMDENPFTHVDKDPFINIFALEHTSAASSSGDANSANSAYVT